MGYLKNATKQRYGKLKKVNLTFSGLQPSPNPKNTANANVMIRPFCSSRDIRIADLLSLFIGLLATALFYRLPRAIMKVMFFILFIFCSSMSAASPAINESYYKHNVTAPCLYV